jgi:uncharacterized membrane protein YdbT with pleckstrin-like domain
MNAEETKLCPVCAETIKFAALKCRFCNADLQAIAAGHESDTEKLLFSGHPATIFTMWQWVVVVMTLGLGYLYYLAKSLAVKYEISTQRVKVERGLFSTEKNSVELFTIEHFDLIKPLGMRLLGFCILQLRLSDVNDPSLSLYGIKDMEALSDTLRDCSLRERARRRITSLIQP